MSSFNADKKREHEALAEKALAAGDYAKAFFHTAQAAEFTFNLADQSDGDVARAYLEDANELVNIAASFKEKAAKSGARVNKEESGGAEVDASAKGKWTVTSVGDILLDDVKGLTEAKAVVMDA
ncbi:MAG: hypothetical protein IJ173_12925, partial [Kiritimatiellae bacterium]|nr:hypothetical protein [Kiritimatiellia bacterium]